MDVKPGIQTTEFWTHLLTQFVSAFVIVFTLVFHRSFIDSATINALLPVAAVVAAGISQIAYVISRAHVKAAAHLAQASQTITRVEVTDGGAYPGGPPQT